MYPLGTWFVSGICVWIPCIKETMMMMIVMIIIIIIIIIIVAKLTLIFDGLGESRFLRKVLAVCFFLGYLHSPSQIMWPILSGCLIQLNAGNRKLPYRT